MSESLTWTRCIVLIPEGSAIGARVGRLAAARDWVAIEQHDPYLAMAEIGIRLRAQRSRHAWGLPTAERMALVIVEPRRWGDLDDFLRALGTYAPQVTIWTFTSDDLSPLTSTTHRPDTPPPAERVAPAAPSPAIEIAPPHPRPRPRPLRLADSGTEFSEPEFDGAAANEPAAAPCTSTFGPDHEVDSDEVRITAEEIEMLLAAPSTGVSPDRSADEGGP